tara:strand:+ start:1075 stop:2556 length:1482 start_codon:yes stop_codon:yes gene_type:complete
MLNRSNKLTGPFMIQLKNKFRVIAGEDQLIDKKEFFEGLEISNRILSDRLFDIFDKDNNGKIDHDEFLSTIEEIISGTKDAKIRFAFKLHDLDGSGFIDKNELTVLISQSFVQNNLDYDDFQLKLLVDEFFEKADKDKNGSIDIDEFLNIAIEFPDFIEGFAVNPIRWLAHNESLQISGKTEPLKKRDKEIQVQDIGFFQSILIPRMISYYNILLNRKKNHVIVDFISSSLLPSQTLEIVIKPPISFNFIPGDYLYLNCDIISSIEWHPFNIIQKTKKNELVLHIKSSDKWTKKMYDIVVKKSLEKKDFHLPLKVDGPYGSSSEAILNTEHAILVGAGHGISRIAPILQDIAMRIDSDSKKNSIQKISLFWLIENETYFEWFTKFLDEIESEEKLNIFSYNIFFINKSSHEVSEKLMYMSTDIVNTKTDVTLIDNIWGKSKFGLPNWGQELNQVLKEENTLKRRIFYSGPSALRKSLKKEAWNLKIPFQSKDF